MILLILIAALVITALIFGWRVFAEETSARAANALLAMLAVLGFAWWLMSNMSFDAGLL